MVSHQSVAQQGHKDSAIKLKFPLTVMDQSEPPCEAAWTALEAPSDRSLRVACYCEENVWRLAHRLMVLAATAGGGTASTFHVVFVSSESQCCAMWYQMARQGGPCFWDYHCILLETTADDGETRVLDLDTLLPYPCPLQDYLENTFRKVKGQYAPLFRYVQGHVCM